MVRRFSIVYKLTADPGASGEIVIYEVEPAYRFKTESVYIAFPAGTYGELEVAVYRGINQIAPSKGVYCGDNMVIEDEFVEDISSGERVILKYRNLNTTQVREAYIVVRGFLEG